MGGHLIELKFWNPYWIRKVKHESHSTSEKVAILKRNEVIDVLFKVDINESCTSKILIKEFTMPTYSFKVIISMKEFPLSLWIFFAQASFAIRRLNDQI